MDREKALEAAISQIERNCGKGSIMRLGQNEKAVEVEAIPTGSLGLDIALGIGGLPRGRPPMPSAMSRPSEPVEMASTSTAFSFWPRRMMEPLPQFRSICEIAASSAFSLSISAPSTRRSATFNMADFPLISQARRCWQTPVQHDPRGCRPQFVRLS